MYEPFGTKRWKFVCIFLLVSGLGCVDMSPLEANETTGGQPSSKGGTIGSDGPAGTTTNSAKGGSNAAGGNTAIVGNLDPPPAPPSKDVPPPRAAVTLPNLKVLPWAGFAAAVTYTFDDSQPSQTEHWPELKATGVPMTFFANPAANWQSGYDANWTAVAAAGSEIGNHTYSHCCPANLSNCTNKVGDQNAELDQANSYFATRLGVTVTYTFASPCGDAGWTSYAAPRFLVGRGVISGLVSATGVTDWYNLPVFQVAEGQTAIEFNASIDSARSQGKWDIFMFHSIRPTTNDWFAGVEMSGITESLVYARSVGDVWLDTFVEVGAYARAKQMFEALTPSNNTWNWTLPDHFPPSKVLRVKVDGGTLSQGGKSLTWDSHGYYEVALDMGSLSWSR